MTARFRRRRMALSAPVAAALLVAACGGSRQPSGGPPTPSADQTLTEIFNLPAVYNRMGRIAVGPPVPFVGTLAALGGRGDSTIIQVGLSLPNRAFSFQRDGPSFLARFRAEISFNRPGQAPIAHIRDELVRVAGFEETQRSDETIIFQQGFLLAPGEYTVTILVRDLAATAFSRAERPLSVPAFGPGSTSGPILTYEAGARRQRVDSLPLILNPRGSVAHGPSDTLLIYVEGYRFSQPTTVPVDVRDDRGVVVFSDTLRFDGGQEVESRTVRLSASTPPLGELTIAVGNPGGEPRTTQALVSFSRGWVVTNYDNLLSLLRFFPYVDWVRRLREANATERATLWREFWTATDPTPETPENEALDLYFTRVAIANERFRDEGPNAWRSDRGEVFITLGEPDAINTNSLTADRRLEQWVYSELRGVLLFEGQLGFNRMRLVPSSRGEFSRLRALVQRRQ